MGKNEEPAIIRLPYGKTFKQARIPGARVIESRVNALRESRPGIELVREAMRKPIGSAPLHELARGKRDCTIIISDHTRPVPSRDIIPCMLEELRRHNPKIEITLLVATGCHRAPTQDELKEKLGEEIALRERVVVHDCGDMSQCVNMGTLPSGAPLYINKMAAEASLLVSEGFIEPHFFAGFSGGRKSVLPGVCARQTVLGNHCSEFIDSPYARAGVLEGNPLHRDMVAAARMANLQYIVNVVIDDCKKTVAAFAGDAGKAHEAGCEFLRGYCEVEPVPADIVIVTNGGAPLDRDAYQCVKGLSAAEATAREGAVLIICADCADGAGGEAFYRALYECKNADELYSCIMKKPQCETEPDQWQSQVLARILKKHRVLFVTRPENRRIVEGMKMHYFETLEGALDAARVEKGKNADVTVIPNGVSVIVRSIKN